VAAAASSRNLSVAALGSVQLQTTVRVRAHAVSDLAEWVSTARRSQKGAPRHHLTRVRREEVMEGLELPSHRPARRCAPALSFDRQRCDQR